MELPNINTLREAPGMDGEVVVPADHDPTNGPWLMERPRPAWADRPGSVIQNRHHFTASARDEAALTH